MHEPGLERLGEVSVLVKMEKNSFLFSASSSPKKLDLKAALDTCVHG
jgi:hypothetical protein